MGEQIKDILTLMTLLKTRRMCSELNFDKGCICRIHTVVFRTQQNALYSAIRWGCATFAPIQLNLILSWADEIHSWQDMQLEPRSSKNQLKYLDQMEAFKVRKDLMSDWQDKTYCLIQDDFISGTKLSIDKNKDRKWDVHEWINLKDVPGIIQSSFHYQRTIRLSSLWSFLHGSRY